MVNLDRMELSQSLARLSGEDLALVLSFTAYLRNEKLPPTTKAVIAVANPTPRKGKGGRPKGSKNKSKAIVPPPATVEMLIPSPITEFPPVPVGYGVSN